MSKSTVFDIIVIGGGALGGAAVIELAKSGHAIGWLRHEAPGNSATAAAGAMLGAYGEIGAPSSDPRDREEFEFRIASQTLFPDWLRDIRERTRVEVFDAKGSFVVGSSAGSSDRLALRNIMDYSEEFHGGAQWVEPSEVPGLKTADRFEPTGCVYLPFESAISTADLLAALERYAEVTSNITPVRIDVKSVIKDGGNWLVQAGDEQYSAPSVVVCAGSRTRAILGPSVIDDIAFPELFFGKGVSVVLDGEAVSDHTIRTPNRAFACGVHVVPRRGGHTYLGATNFFGSDHAGEAGIEVGELHILFDQAIHQINTDLRRRRVISSTFGYRPITTQRIPMVGRTKADGLYVGTGTYRNGVVMAPLIGKLIAQDVLGESSNYSNPYRPSDQRIERKPSLQSVVSQGIGDIVAILHEPNGSLPYGRSKELAQFLDVIFKLALEEQDQSGLREFLREKLEQIPLNETMNRVFYDVIERHNYANGYIH